ARPPNEPARRHRTKRAGLRPSSDVASFSGAPAARAKPAHSKPPRIWRQTDMPFCAEVRLLHHGARPYGWLIYARGSEQPAARSESGYQSEADAWSAVGGVMTRMGRQGSK